MLLELEAATLLALFWFSLRYYGLTPGDFANDYDSYSKDAQMVLTMMFTTFVFQQLCNVFNSRTETGSVLKDWVPNRSLVLVVAVLAVIQVCVVEIGFLQAIFRTVDLSVAQIVLCAALASIVILTEEFRKALDRAVLRRAER